MIVVAIVWSLLFNPTNGFINQLLSFVSFGLIEPIEWLYDTKHALNAIIILSIWQGVGFQMIIVLAGLQGILIMVMVSKVFSRTYIYYILCPNGS